MQYVNPGSFTLGNAHIEAPYAIVITNAAPTPRFEVGEKTAAAQLLLIRLSRRESAESELHKHYERKKTEETGKNEKYCKIRRADASLYTESQNKVSRKCYSSRGHYVPATILRTVRVDSLPNNKCPILTNQYLN
jgi:hypothetical protein